MRIKEILIYVIVTAFNIIVSLLLNKLLFSGINYFIFCSCFVALVSYIVILILAKKFSVSLDMLRTEYIDEKDFYLNSFYVAEIISIPLSLFFMFFL